jgi:type I restriction enzyme M protein
MAKKEAKEKVVKPKAEKAPKKAAKPAKEVSIEQTLWAAADKLRGTVESSEYKHVVLSLIFLKFSSDKFEERKHELIVEGKEKYIEQKEFYNMKNVFFLPEESRWSYIIKNSKQNDISIKIDTALHTVEKNNPSLKGALPDNYFSRLNMDVSKLSALLDTINNIDTLKDKQQDIVGRVYEYFLSKFALAEGKGKGEFYTPKSIVNLIAEMIEPYKGIIYDPACGSGGMFVQSIKFIESHHGNKKEVSIYGQEYTATTYKLAKMNLAIRGISANLGDVPADTFGKDQHPDLKADFIMANPPFNQKDWRAANELTDDPRWRGYEVPPTSNANYAWILNMVSKLSENGVAGFILANGALSGGGEEYKIRKKLIENGLVEAIVILPNKMFYTTDISVTLWLLNNNKKSRKVKLNDIEKKYRNREDEILFMDLRFMGVPFEKKYIQFTQEEIKTIVDTYHNWQQEGNKYKDVPEFCYSAKLEEIRKKDFALAGSKYIEFINRDENIDFDEKMGLLQKDFFDLLKAEEQSKKDLLNVFKELGYAIKL